MLDSLTHLNRYLEKKKRGIKGAFHSENTEEKGNSAIEMVNVVKPAAILTLEVS